MEVAERRGLPRRSVWCAQHKQRVRWITRRSGGRNLAQVARGLGEYLRGWQAYFKLAETPGIFAELDGGIHRRLRARQLKHWKRGRTPFRELRSRLTGVADRARRRTRPPLVVGGPCRRAASGTAGAFLRTARGPAVGCIHLNTLNRRMRTRMSGGVGGE